MFPMADAIAENGYFDEEILNVLFHYYYMEEVRKRCVQKKINSKLYFIIQFKCSLKCHI